VLPIAGGAPASKGQGCEPELLQPLFTVDDDSLWTLTLKLLLLELLELPCVLVLPEASTVVRPPCWSTVVRWTLPFDGTEIGWPLTSRCTSDVPPVVVVAEKWVVVGGVEALLSLFDEASLPLSALLGEVLPLIESEEVLCALRCCGGACWLGMALPAMAAVPAKTNAPASE